MLAQRVRTHHSCLNTPTTLLAGACPDVGDSRAVARTDSQRASARATEAARLEAVLAAAAKCNAALGEEDMALL